jgi:hypothetical protein
LTLSGSHVPLFDHLVGDGEQCRRHVEAEPFGGLDIVPSLAFRRAISMKKIVFGLGIAGALRFRTKSVLISARYAIE